MNSIELKLMRFDSEYDAISARDFLEESGFHPLIASEDVPQNPGFELRIPKPEAADAAVALDAWEDQDERLEVAPVIIGDAADVDR